MATAVLSYLNCKSDLGFLGCLMSRISMQMIKPRLGAPQTLCAGLLQLMTLHNDNGNL